MGYVLSLKNDSYTAKSDASYVFNPFRIKEPTKYQQKLEEIKIKRMFERKQKEMEEEIYRNKKATVSQIITEHPRKGKNVDVENITEMIMAASQETGIDSVVIAHIAGQESGFRQNVPRANGTGIMQLTSITIKDMFLRPKYYGGEIKNILNKYKTPKKLMEAAAKDPQLNITLGAYCFKAKMKLAKGNLGKALEYYKTGDGKHSYSKTILARVQKSKQNCNFASIA